MEEDGNGRRRQRRKKKEETPNEELVNQKKTRSHGRCRRRRNTRGLNWKKNEKKINLEVSFIYDGHKMFK